MAGHYSRPGVGEADVLAAVPLFAGLTSADRAELATAARPVTVQGTGWLFRQGDADDGLYVVVSGRVELSIDGKTVRIVGPGEALGEMALLTAGTRSASARAMRDAELLHISRESFDALIERVPGFARALLRLLALKAAEAVPAQQKRVPLRVLAVVERNGDLARSLAAALPNAVVLGHGDAPADEREWGRTLDAAERASDWVVLDGAGPEEWRSFCLRQADRIVAPPRRPLTKPGIERLARRLSGQAVGVVLSGGGARGLAHIGVIERLLDAGIEIDRVGGVSIGSFIGALFAGGMEPAELTAVCRAELVAKRPFSDFTVPRVSVIRGQRATQMIRRLTGEADIEDLPRSFFCITADLLSARGDRPPLRPGVAGGRGQRRHPRLRPAAADAGGPARRRRRAEQPPRRRDGCRRGGTGDRGGRDAFRQPRR